MSGRQNKKPKYLQDYDQGDKKGRYKNSEDEEFDSEEISEEDDESEEEYVSGRYRKTGQRGGRGRGSRGGGRQVVDNYEPNNHKRQRLMNFPDEYMKNMMDAKK
jgi:hypothetical protein